MALSTSNVSNQNSAILSFAKITGFHLCWLIASGGSAFVVTQRRFRFEWTNHLRRIDLYNQWRWKMGDRIQEALDILWVPRRFREESMYFAVVSHLFNSLKHENPRL